MKRILILTATFGEGHNAAARNLKEAFSRSGVEARVEDVFLNAYGWLNRLSQKGYLAVINHAPGLWQFIFDLLNDTNILNGIGIFKAAKREMHRLLSTFKPDWIVSTYPGCNYLLDNIYKNTPQRPYRQATIVTDSITINSVWYHCHSDLFFVPNNDTAEILLGRKIPAEKIQTLGFPTPLAFVGLNAGRKYPPENGIWRILYVVNSAQHLAPMLVERLLTIPNTHLTVTYGHDEHLGKILRKQVKAHDQDLDIYGWTPEISRLMAESHLIISKAGGATVQECLAASTPLIASQVVPGQEVGNAILLERHHAGIIADTPDKIISAIHAALENKGKILGEWHEGAASLSHPNAAKDIAEYILNR